ncbi:MAG: ATP-binding protein [Clostridia bacterium]|nr:ATP-binding protein [Clostridia bacterium]
MLLQFTVSNFLSFRDPVTFDMRPGNIQKEGALWDQHVYEDREGGKTLTLPLGIIYGANAGGKSNFASALYFMWCRIFLGMQDPAIQIREAALEPIPFLLDAEMRSRPSLFSVRFKQDGCIYDYGFTILEKQIQEEWLYTEQNGEETKVFHRFVEGEESTFDGTTAPEQLLELGTYAPSSILLLSMYQKLLPLSVVYEWFRRLCILSPNTHYSELDKRVFQDPEFAEFLSRALHEVDTGICKVAAHKKENAAPSSEESLSTSANQNVQYRLFTFHDTTAKLPLPIGLESSGTRRLMHLLPGLYELERGQLHTLVIDELDNSLHPLLSQWFIRKFLAIPKTSRSQLIFTTHDSTLLSMDDIRKDEVWFMEKDGKGVSQLSRLSEFNTKPDLNYASGYLSGRFGGIPVIHSEKE